MGDKTTIEWTRSPDGTAGASWNPVAGCTKVSPGCDHCYAEAIATRFAGTPAYPDGFAVTLHPDRLTQPLRWTRPRRIFVCSMADLFHADVPDDYIAQVFEVMALAPQHTFLVLTKRHARMRSLLSSRFDGDPLPNVWVGVSAEDQHWWDIRVPALLETPAAVRFVSAEPLLGPIGPALMAGLDWLIVGGESGPHARPMDPEWVRDLRDGAGDAGVPFFFKQWGGLRSKSGGRELDGRTWDQMPEVLS